MKLAFKSAFAAASQTLNRIGSLPTGNPHLFAGASLQVAAVLVPLALFIAFAFWSWTSTLSDARTRAARIATAIAEHAQRVFEVQEALLRSALVRARPLSFEQLEANKELQAFLAEAERHAPSARSLVLVRPDTGSIVSWSEGEAARSNIAYRDFVQAHRAGAAQPYVGEIIRTVTSDLVGFTFSLRDSASGLIAASLLTIDGFRDFYIGLRESPRDSVGLVRHDGAVLVRMMADTSAGERLPANAIALRLIRGEVLDLAIDRSVFDNIERLWSKRRVGDTSAYAVYGLDMAGVHAAWLRQVAPFGALSLLASSLLLLLSRRVQAAAEARRLAELETLVTRARAEQAELVAASEARYRAAFEVANVGKMEVDAATGRYGLVNDAFCEIVGYSREELLAMRPADLIHADGAVGDNAVVDAFLRGETDRYSAEKRFVRKDGRVIWVAINCGLVRDADGRPRHSVGVLSDITERKRAEDALRESEATFRAMFSVSSVGKCQVDYRTGRFLRVNRALCDLTGYSEEELLARTFLDITHPDDRAFDRDKVRQMTTGEQPVYDVEKRYIRKDGGVIWVRVNANVIRDAKGRPLRNAAIIQDITDRKRHEQNIQLLLREVNHRSKNMLTIVQAIARQTAAGSPNEFVERFSQRIQALAANQDLLVANEWRGVELADLVRAQLDPFADLIGNRISIDGPPVRLSPAAAQAIGMALHELATNAGKYGALSGDDGRVTVTWSLTWSLTAGQDGRFTMAWRESGGPPVTPPARRGFGTTVMSTAAKTSLNGEVDLQYAPTGIVWQLDCPAAEALERVPHRAPPLQPVR